MSPFSFMLNTQIHRMFPVPDGHTLWRGTAPYTYEVCTLIGRRRIHLLNMQNGDPRETGHNGVTVNDLLELLIDHTEDRPELKAALMRALNIATKG